ncbi:MAG TPA: nuclear transport factor 2 family protein [Gemmatimonadales bacterium]
MRTGVLAVVAIAACAPSGPTFTDADKAAIMEQRAAFAAAINAADWDKAADTYAEDAVLMFANQPAINGRLAIRAAFAAFPPVSEFRMYGEEVIGAGDAAVIRGGVSMLMMPAGSPVALADTLKFVEVWRRQADGTWKLQWDIANTDRPAEAFLPPGPAK